ncbi:hypothetical protein BC940DRAFT_312119 [Gongronella butleri]|nr:hypothetical protein BC940DRAFT_312119 [Gongronella butleri]
MRLLFTSLLLCLPCWVAAVIKDIVVFGDDYSDVGSGQKYTNGPLWSQQLAVGWEATLHSFAYSGSVCNGTLGKSLSSIVDQTESYYHKELSLDPQSTIYAFWAGHQDLRAMVDAGNDDYSLVVDCLMDQLRVVRKVFKTDRFLMFTLAPMDLMPDAKTMSKEKQQAIKSAVNTFNELLHDKVFNQVKHHHLLELDLVDVHDLLVDVIEKPDDYGFSNGADAFWDHCQGRCDDKQDEYIWWDKQHLSGNAHHIIAKSILMSDSMEPATTLPALDTVRAAVDAPHSISHSQLYPRPPKAKGLLDKIVTQINEAKKKHDKDAAQAVADDMDMAQNDPWLRPLYLGAFCTVMACIAFVYFTKQQRRRGGGATSGLAALSSLVQKGRHQDTSNRGQFTRLRNLESSV